MKRSRRTLARSDGSEDALLALAADVYWEQDALGRFTLLEARPGYDAGPLLAGVGDAPFSEARIGGPERSPPQGFRNAVRSFAAAGGPRSLRFNAEPRCDEGGTFQGYRGFAWDVTDQLRGERLRALENTVLRSLAGADNVAGALTAVMEAVCASEGWQRGSFFTCDAAGLLVYRSGWGTLHAAADGSPEDGSAGSALALLTHVPRWLGDSDEPHWIPDVEAESRTATRSGTAAVPRAAVLVPARAGRTLVGVLEFRALEVPQQPSLDLVRALRTLGAEVGRFYQRFARFERLRETEQRFAATMELAAIGIAHVANDGRFTYVNPQLCAMLGYREPELLRLTVQDVAHPDDVGSTDALRTRLHAGDVQSFKIDKRYVTKHGATVWMALTVAARRDSTGRGLHEISIVEDISARKSAEERVHHLATHDGLTDLPNRLLFMQMVDTTIEVAKRYARGFGLLFIDLDRFKWINDTLGHEAGDILLREVAIRIRGSLRASDVVARFGGDEFVVLVHEARGAGALETVAQHLLNALAKPLSIRGQEFRTTASIGVALYPDDGAEANVLLRHADRAMYAAKQDGKNSVRVYADTMSTDSTVKLRLDTHLRRAVERHEFHLHYQPRIQLKTGRISGVEALLRWQNAELGAVAPVDFIPLAEETGLIVPIGAWVLATACAQNVAWQRAGAPAVRVSVNLSLRQLAHEGLVEEIAAVLRTTGMAPDQLELEITESMIMHDSDKAARVLNAIKALGVLLAIDDFGTGYSSLAQLKRFPIDTLKLDRSFVRGLPTDPEDRAIAEAIIAIGRTLDLTIVAEGVETLEQQRFLTENACDEMQGYLFSKPVPADEVAVLLSLPPRAPGEAAHAEQRMPPRSAESAPPARSEVQSSATNGVSGIRTGTQR